METRAVTAAGMSNHSTEELQAVQGVVDRVSSYQDGAPEGTVAKELQEALAETDVSLTPDEVGKLADAIESEHGSVDAATVLG
jgi:NAD(P)-dependent dehydrogenase (short-subunit alcohol dehydrogenase family)